MEDRESGSLSRKPALELLVELHRGLVTGSLKLERAPLQKAVYFRDGQILFAASNDPKDQLASILVEEGKLGPDQMQVAQARVSPGNPLAKVLTELGYISQRELAEAARVKVEKILTDLYTWKEGTYQFATKSLPKGAIDLELSTSRLLFASIRRVQDREWILGQLGSLDTVLAPTTSLEQFVAECQPEPLATEVLRLADGGRTVKQIGAASSLGEFEVCKVLTAALVVGALTREGAAAPAFAAADDAFSPPPPPESFSFPAPPEPVFGAATVPMAREEPAAPESMSYDTIFQAAVVKPPIAVEEDAEKTVFEPPPLRNPEPAPAPLPPPPIEFREPPRATVPSQLLIDEPEPASDGLTSRTPPRPRKRAGGGGGSRSAGGALKWAGAAAVLAAAAFAIYTFVWPLVGGSGAGDSSTAGSAPLSTSTAPAAALPSGSASAAPIENPPADPRAGAASAPPASGAPAPPVPTAASTSVPAPAPGAATPPPTASASAGSSRPADPRASASGAPRPPTRSSAGGDGRALLRSGNLNAAAEAFEREISSESAGKFTVALGLYCNEDNVGRLVAGAGDSSQVYVLPTSVNGRSCYRVIWGLFDSRDAAADSIGTLPGGLRSGDAAPVAVSRFLR